MDSDTGGTLGFAFHDPKTSELAYFIGPARQAAATSEAKGNPELERDQIGSFASALAAHGVEPGQFEPIDPDPPDFRWTLGDRTWNLELTQLTLPMIRVVQGQLHLVAFGITQRLLAEPERFAHLVGLRVKLIDIDAGDLRYDKAMALATVIADALEQHADGPAGVGLVGGRPSGPEGLPKWGFEGVRVVLDSSDDSNAPLTVTSSLQLSITVRAVQEALDACLGPRKDDPRNDVVLVSTEAPSDKGLIWVQESWLYRIAVEHRLTCSVEPSHLDAIYLHRYGRDDVTLLWVRPGTVPPVPGEILDQFVTSQHAASQ